MYAVLFMMMMSGEAGCLAGCFSKRTSNTVYCLECSDGMTVLGLRHPSQVDSVSKLTSALHLPSRMNLVKE